MLINYIKIAFRNLIKHKFYTFINVMGLAVGLASCLLIFFWVQDELSYDRYNANIDRLYRVYYEFVKEGKVRTDAESSWAMAEALQEALPEIEAAVRINNSGTFAVTHGELSSRVEKVAYAENSLFDVFSIPLLKGDPNTALKEPNALLSMKVRREKSLEIITP